MPYKLTTSFVKLCKNKKKPKTCIDLIIEKRIYAKYCKMASSILC